MDAIGILPQYTGRAIHDRLSSYDHYACAHSVCGAHLLRDCLLIAERDQHPWAQEMHDLLVRMSHLAAQFRAAGGQRLPQAERDGLVLQYFAILEQGFAFHRLHAPVPDVPIPKKPGRRKQADAKNLLDALLARAEQILAFLDDLSVPFTNNLAERDLRMSHPSSKRFLAPFASRTGSHGFLHHSQLSVYHAQAGSLHAGRFGCGL